MLYYKMSELKYNVILLIGKAGSGKTKLQNELVKNNNFNKVITYTTRPPREKEINGQDYYFIDEIQSCPLPISFKVFNNWWYGTSLNNFDINKINVLITTPEEISIYKHRTDFNILAVYLLEVSKEERVKRQQQREKQVDINEIQRRLETDELDFDQKLFSTVTIIQNENIQDLNNNVHTIWAKFNNDK